MCVFWASMRCVLAFAFAVSALQAKALPGEVLSEQKITSTLGGFAGLLDDNDEFGTSVVGIGDLDGDGIGDLAVGARADSDGGAGRCAVWILFLNADSTVKSEQKISDMAGGFLGGLNDLDFLAVRWRPWVILTGTAWSTLRFCPDPSEARSTSFS